MKRNVSLDRGGSYTLYPNIYVLYLAKSGLRKGVPVSRAREWVEKAGDTRIIWGRSSIQGIVKDMSLALTKEDGTIVKGASVFIGASEFGSSIIQDIDAIKILTDLYDGHYNPSWSTTLSTQSKRVLRDMHVTLLGASNEENLRGLMTKSAVEGGFVARTFIVFEEKKRTINALTQPIKRRAELNSLHEGLKEIALNAKGAFTFSPEGESFFISWYNKHEMNKKEDSTGTLERMADSSLKVAMLLSLSDDPQRYTLEKKFIEESIEACQLCFMGAKRLAMGAGEGEYARKIEITLKKLLGMPSHRISRKRLLQWGWGEFDAIDLDRIIETLTQSGAITTEKHGDDIFYIMPDFIVKQYEQFKRG